MTWTSSDVPKPPRLANGSPAHAEVGPLVARRVAAVLDALNELEAPDPTNREGALQPVAIDGAIALYLDECISDDDATSGLVGWLQPVDQATWCFAGYAQDAS